MKPLLAALATLLLAVTAPAIHAAEGKPFYGYAYDLKSGKYLYTEVHQPEVEGGRTVGGTIRYHAPDGSLLGRKTLDYRADPYVPIYKLDLVKEGYMESIVSNAGPIVMAKVSNPGEAEQRKSIAKQGLMAADSGFHHLVQAQLPKLVAGETVNFRFAVAGRLDSYKFAIKKVGDASFEGAPAVKLLVQADSLLRYVAPDLQLLYDPASKRLLEYKGTSNVHDPKGGKAYTVRIVYLATPPADAPKNLPALR